MRTLFLALLWFLLGELFRVLRYGDSAADMFLCSKIAFVVWVVQFDMYTAILAALNVARIRRCPHDWKFGKEKIWCGERIVRRCSHCGYSQYCSPQCGQWLPLFEQGVSES